MNTDFSRLECSKGCCLEKVKHLAEQVYRQQDDIMNIAMAENIELGNYVGDYILPYLERQAERGDLNAMDLLIDLSQMVVPRG